MSEAQERSEQKTQTESETDFSESSQELRDGLEYYIIKKSFCYIIEKSEKERETAAVRMKRSASMKQIE